MKGPVVTPTPSPGGGVTLQSVLRWVLVQVPGGGQDQEAAGSQQVLKEDAAGGPD